MLPPIALVSSVEMIRDGGSLAAIFQVANGSEYWLFFRVDVQELPSGEVERVGYKSPVVVERQVGNEVEVSWQHAKILLNQMRPLLREESHRTWLEAMYVSAEANGALPPRVERILGRPVQCSHGKGAA
jgi:hypothetical protein